jgi:hypothetical protein
LLTPKGKVLTAAKANLRPFRAELGQPVEIKMDTPAEPEIEPESDLEDWLSDD